LTKYETLVDKLHIYKNSTYDILCLSVSFRESPGKCNINREKNTSYTPCKVPSQGKHDWAKVKTSHTNLHKNLGQMPC